MSWIRRYQLSNATKLVVYGDRSNPLLHTWDGDHRIWQAFTSRREAARILHREWRFRKRPLCHVGEDQQDR